MLLPLLVQWLLSANEMNEDLRPCSGGVKMIVRKTDQTYIRHVERESLLWNPRTSACCVIQDGEAFLRPLGDEFRAMEDVVSDVAQTFGENSDTVRKDVISFYAVLVLQGFVECKATELNVFDAIVEEKTGGREINSSDDDGEEVSPFDDFCEQHGIVVDLHIDLTDACTERCVHCYVPKGQKDFLPVELVEKALTEFRAMNGLTVHLTGGEAMMHPDFERICRKCVELNLNFIIFSNIRFATRRGLRS